MTSLAGEPWFREPSLHRVLSLLNQDGGEGRVVGGAVRNSLMGLPVGDIDIATTLRPETVMARAAAAGIKAVPTGVDHGTVTLVVDHRPFEVTTLRRDVATDGRRAEVAFDADWRQDAARRDLTINALFADAAGEVIDLVGGLADIKTGTVRFIGDAAIRIAEDYLRILRFFRFFAHYGSGRPDAEGLKASAMARGKLKTLLAERIWSEVKKLLSAVDPGRALLWMRTSGVLTEILPETEKWGIDAIPALVATEQALGWEPDPLLRLAAIVQPDEERMQAMAARLRLSNVEANVLVAWAKAPAVADTTADVALDRLLYRHGRAGLVMRLKLALAAVRTGSDAEAMKRALRLNTLLKRSETWRKPEFPVSGADVLAAGVAPGPRVGEILAKIEDYWVGRNFHPDRAALVARMHTLIEQRQ